VVVSNPEKGPYDIVITHKGSLTGGKQAVSLVISGMDYAFYASGDYTLTANNGTFTATTADEYLPDMAAGWLISPGNGEHISLYFDFLDTEAAVDVLKVYDGADTLSPFLAEFSGYLANNDTVLVSSGKKLYVSFSSDSQTQERGFKAIYCTTAPEGSFRVSGEIYPCAATYETYKVTGPEGAYYTWQPPEGWELGETGDGEASIGIGAGQEMIGVVPYNRCDQADAVFLEIMPISTPPVLTWYSGDTILCSAEQGTLMVDSIPGAGYSWTLPENWLGSSLTQALVFIPSDGPGEVVVSAYNACGSGDSITIPVQVNTIPDEAQILTILQGKVCENSIDTFYVEGEEGIQYAWGVPYGWEVISGDMSDTVVVQVGEDPGLVEVASINQCGSSYSDRYISLESPPDEPTISTVSSKYEGTMQFELQNSSDYKSFLWLRNGQPIIDPLAYLEDPPPPDSFYREDVYVAYVPGAYSVVVTSQEGCTLEYSDDDLRISGPDQNCAAYCGGYGRLVVESVLDASLPEYATMKVYDLSGKMVMNNQLSRGYNEFQTMLKGVYIVSVTGWGNEHLFRLFIY
jgi:hypothetical protein